VAIPKGIGKERRCKEGVDLKKRSLELYDNRRPTYQKPPEESEAIALRNRQREEITKHPSRRHPFLALKAKPGDIKTGGNEAGN